MIVVIEAFSRFATLVVRVQDSVIGSIASETVAIVIAGLAVVGTVGAKLLHHSFTGKLRQI